MASAPAQAGRTGHTTGTCAAAAAKAAAKAIVGELVHSVEVVLPGGDRLTLPVKAVERVGTGRAWAKVVKEAGDDPDITDGVTLHVEVEVLDHPGRDVGQAAAGGPPAQVIFVAGPGVGMVTRPGLQLPVGDPAINPVPRAMIAETLREVLGPVRCRVTVSIPGGEELAARTLNSRLGVLGGLSILGTSGRVYPRSDKAWVQALLPQIDVAMAADQRVLYLVPGRFGEKAAVEVFGAPPEAVIRCSNFVGVFLDACVERGVERVVLVGHAGKLVKLAAGIFDTHSSSGDARLETVAAMAAAAGASPSLVARLLALPTVEAAVDLLAEARFSDVWDDIAERAAQKGRARALYCARTARHGTPSVDCALVDYRGSILGRSAGLRQDVHDAPAPQPHVTVVGVGPGEEAHLTSAAWRVIRRAQVLVGGERHLARYAPENTERVPVHGDMKAVAATVESRLGSRTVVLASGDPNCYGIGTTLKKMLPHVVVEVVPGVSSFQLALARLGLSWADVRFASAHGRDLTEILAAVATSTRVLLFTDRENSPQAIARELLDRSFEGKATVLERLGYPDERFTEGDLVFIAQNQFDPLSVMLVEATKSCAGIVGTGLPDQAFERGRTPMTKAEVRAVLLSKARLLPHSRVLDIGAGSGSITVEACLACPAGAVVAVEREADALALLRSNLARFGLTTVRVIDGEAPEALAGLGQFDRVFVGGSGDRLADILEALPSLLVPRGRVVFSCACVETLALVVERLRTRPWSDFDCVQLSIARAVPAGGKLRFAALNPVWVVAAELVGDDDGRGSSGSSYPRLTIGSRGDRRCGATAVRQERPEKNE